MGVFESEALWRPASSPSPTGPSSRQTKDLSPHWCPKFPNEELEQLLQVDANEQLSAAICLVLAAVPSKKAASEPLGLAATKCHPRQPSTACPILLTHSPNSRARPPRRGIPRHMSMPLRLWDAMLAHVSCGSSATGRRHSPSSSRCGCPCRSHYSVRIRRQGPWTSLATPRCR